MADAPRYVTDYIDYLKKLQSSNPDALYSRYSLGDNRPPITFESIFDSARGWIVNHSNANTGQLLLSELVEPPVVNDAGLPPVEFDSTSPLKAPSVAPPAGYFVLSVQNRGLPLGYAAQTQIISRLVENSSDNTNGTNISVPFKGQYQLPVFGTIDKNKQLQYTFTTSGSVKTKTGEYIAFGPFATIVPKSSEYYEVTIQWTLNNSSVLVPVQPAVIGPRVLASIPTGTQANIVGTKAQPILHLSQTPQPPPPLPFLPPTYKLTTPFKDPEGTFRATNIQQMFSFIPNDVPRKIVYNVGVPPAILPTKYKIRNNTTNITLQFAFDVPAFLSLDAPNNLNVNPQQEVTITVTFNEQEARSRSTQRTRNFDEFFKWSATPLNLTGPVYVQRTLPSVTFDAGTTPAPPVIQETTIAVVSPAINFNSLTNIYASIDPLRPALVGGDHRTIKADIWAGTDNVAPGTDGSVLLHFGPNSIIWETDNTPILDIDNSNGSGTAILIAKAPGIAQIKMTIVAPPTNIPEDTWKKLFLSSKPLSGAGNRIVLSNGVTGLQVVGVATIFTSNSQARR